MQRKKLFLLVSFYKDFEIKKVVKLAILILCVNVCFTGAKLGYCEFFTNINYLRSCIGKEVVYKCDKFIEYKGTLTTCKYKINDKFGFFSLQIGIKGEKSLKIQNQIVSEKCEIFLCIPVGDIDKITCCECN
jgi:hypothetical protein